MAGKPKEERRKWAVTDCAVLILRVHRRNPVIDLNAVRVGPPLSWPQRRTNLVVLNRWFLLRADRADRLRCWRAYEGEWGARKSATVPSDLEARTLASNLRFWRQQDGRCLSRNRHFRPVAGGWLRGHASAI